MKTTPTAVSRDRSGTASHDCRAAAANMAGAAHAEVSAETGMLPESSRSNAASVSATAGSGSFSGSVSSTLSPSRRRVDGPAGRCGRRRAGGSAGSRRGSGPRSATVAGRPDRPRTPGAAPGGRGPRQECRLPPQVLHGRRVGVAEEHLHRPVVATRYTTVRAPRPSSARKVTSGGMSRLTVLSSAPAPKTEGNRSVGGDTAIPQGSAEPFGIFGGTASRLAGQHRIQAKLKRVSTSPSLDFIDMLLLLVEVPLSTRSSVLMFRTRCSAQGL